MLETRSLLELFADFLGNPNLLLSVCNVESAHERMYIITYWYLTSFHHSKNSRIAKKPYNPVIGEQFECSWKCGEEGITFFMGEQVSHHPPVSAFYFENPKRKICLNGHVLTQSKFLGTSVASLLVGQASLWLLEKDEEYIITYPNAYARSILTVPKMELGGKSSIECKQTGYRSEVEFKTKPIFGGDWHEVDCFIFDCKGVKVNHIYGTWNGSLYEKSLEKKGGKKTPSKMIFQVSQEKKVKKRVKPIEKQKNFESRKIWQNVTKNLVAKNLEQATQMKKMIEEEQREIAKQRKASQQIWEPRQFFWHENSQRWIYKNSLVLEKYETT
eukprot:Sdes_comp20558_c1_seq4m15372